jgi:drug/metabolite transporter (DMT)-like permease
MSRRCRARPERSPRPRERVAPQECGLGQAVGVAGGGAAELKTIEEVISLVVFAFFSVLYLKEEFRWNYAVGFVLMICAVFVVFHKW